MTDFQQGDLILYRDIDRFAVARVDLVREKHLTSFPFDHNYREFKRGRRRIGRNAVVQRIKPSTDLVALMAQIEAQRHQHEVAKQQAKASFERRIAAIARKAPPCS